MRLARMRGSMGTMGAGRAVRPMRRVVSGVPTMRPVRAVVSGAMPRMPAALDAAMRVFAATLRAAWH